MAYTRAQLRASLRVRLNEPTASVWSDADLNEHLAAAVDGIYPTFYKYQSDTTTAGAGPAQTHPTGARNIYSIQVIRTGTERARPLRHWVEGDGSTVIPKAGITGDTLVWGWTEGWTLPSDDETTVALNPEARELVLIRAHIAALEDLLTSRAVKTDKFYALQVRESITEDELVGVLEALHASARERADRAQPLPEVEK